MNDRSANKTAKSLVTPTGSTMFASLLTGQVFGGQPTPGNPGHLETLLVLDPRKPEVQAFYKELDAECDRLIEAASGESVANLRAKGMLAECAYNRKPDTDENKQPTGMDRIKLRRSAGGIRPDGSTYTNSISFCDSQRQPITLEEELGNGSLIQAIVTPYAFSNNRWGISLQLKAVQVVEARKRPTRGGSEFDMFATQEPQRLDVAGAPEVPANFQGGAVQADF